MKIVVTVNQNNNSITKLNEFQKFNIGTITTTLQALLDAATIQINENITPILVWTDRCHFWNS